MDNIETLYPQVSKTCYPPTDHQSNMAPLNGKLVYISSASADRDRGQPAIAKLISPENNSMSFEADQNVWSADFEFKPGDNIRHQLKNHIKTASKVVVLWSKHAATSQHVQYELGLADALEKPLTIVQLDKKAPPLPTHLKHRVVDLSEG